MAVHLVFGRARHAGGPVDLVFGAGLTPPTPDPLTAQADIVLGGLQGGGVLLYDNRNPRRATTAASAAHQVAARALPERAIGWGLSARGLGQTASAWRPAAPAAAESAAAWVTSARRLQHSAAPWRQATAVQAERSAVHQRAAQVRALTQAPWGTGAPASAATELVHQAALSLLAQALAPWQVAQARQALATSRHGVGAGAVASLLMPWQIGRPLPPGREVWPPVRPGTVTPREISTHLLFACPPAWLGSGPVHLVFGRVCQLVPSLVRILPRTYYMTINQIDLRRVAGNVQLPCHGFTMALDADSWTWSWSATLDRSAESLVQPVGGVPVELAATINGVPYRLLVGRIGRSVEFPKTRLRLSGRGLADMLAAPQAPVATWSNPVDMTAQQLAEQVLTVNGVSNGWAVNWGLTDWLVPGGSWTFQGTPIEALQDIAGAVGGYIQPHATAQTLRVLPRYPVAPWDWASATPDVELPRNVVDLESMDWVDRPAYNRVYVGGVSAGVFGPVTRAGSAGDVLAPQVTHSLITHADAHRQRGLAVLADTGRQVHMSLKLPVLPETGLILPGKLVRYVADQTRVGIVRSVSLDWSSPVMRQTIGVESHAA